ncbi:hypothetical protein [endosymbiont of unidentified scaly snail isolate Monju]|uniref:hypothetical protein n=1 Tax=endosymbiont of unidentified scaly snail isolate Monju TaxID=1248727 RepID=UPI0005BE7E00|nr:hypothetical protein [endosymbiont of unidentified scaly snail isolate Monju]
MTNNGEWRRPLGLVCLLASLGVLFFQQAIGQYIGTGVLPLWLGLGGVGVWLLGPIPEDA